MNFAIILPHYLIWHYGPAFSGYLRIWRNYFKFLWNIFSIKTLSRTLFEPWQRIQDAPKRGADIEEMVGDLIFNGIMRALGIFIRMATIIIGVSFIAILAILGVVFLIIWSILPAIVLLLLAFGIQVLFS